MSRNIVRTNIIFAAAIIGLAFYQCSSSEKKTKFGKGAQSPSMPVPVNAVVAHHETLENKIEIIGNILPNEKVELKSEVSGRITGIHFKEGQQIKKGKLLVSIYDHELRAQLKRVRMQQQLAKIDEERKRKLIEIKGISQQEYDIAKNQTDLLKADADLIEAQLSKSTIYAPFDGVIGLRYASEGETVTPATPIASFQQIDPIRIEFDIPEKYNNLVGPQSTINFMVSGNTKVYSGTVYAIEPVIDVNTGTLKIRARSSNKDMSLKPGAFIKIELLLNTDDKAIIVPSESVIPGAKGQKVFVYKNGIALSKEITTGVRQEQTLQVTSGIQPNDTVITSGTMQLKDSTKVNITIIK